MAFTEAYKHLTGKLNIIKSSSILLADDIQHCITATVLSLEHQWGLKRFTLWKEKNSYSLI